MQEELDFSPNRDRVPPQNIEAEEAVLGGIMLDPEALPRIMDDLNPEAFYLGVHKYIYQAAIKLYQQESPVDLLTVTSWLSENGLLEKVGGRNKLAQLVDRTVSAVNIEALATLVVEKYRRRQLIKAASEILNLAYVEHLELSEVLSRSEEKILAATAQSFNDTEPVHLSQIVSNAYDRYEARSEGSNPIAYPTGYFDLDDVVNGGLSPGKLITVAARPGCGKSSFLGNVAVNMAKIYPALIFSLEMGVEEWGDRLISQQAQIESGFLRSGKISQSQWEPLVEGITQLADVNLYVDDSPTATVTSIRSKVRRMISKVGKLSMVGIDYLGLMEDVDSGGNNLAHSVGKVTRALKQLSRECDVPIVLLAQLNRGVEARKDKRPMLSDLRDSGRIEEDSDIVLMLYRDELYNRDTPDRGVAELGITKNRAGAVGTIKLLFDARFTQFKNFKGSRGW